MKDFHAACSCYLLNWSLSRAYICIPVAGAFDEKCHEYNQWGIDEETRVLPSWHQLTCYNSDIPEGSNAHQLDCSQK